MPYKIELRYSYGWDDAGWTDEIAGRTKPTRFQTVAEAQMALVEFLGETQAAANAGDMEAGHDSEEYRIVKLNR